MSFTPLKLIFVTLLLRFPIFGGEEIGVCPGEAHWVGRGRGSLPPVGEAGDLTSARERGNTGKPGTSSAGPPDRWNHVNYTLFFHCL